MSNEDPFFGLSQIHVLMAAVGAAVFIAHLLPRILFKRGASSSAIMMLAGLVIFNFMPGMPDIPDPTVSPALWEITSEIVVIVVLFATGLQIDDIKSWKRWRPTVRYLAGRRDSPRPARSTFAIGAPH